MFRSWFWGRLCWWAPGAPLHFEIWSDEPSTGGGESVEGDTLGGMGWGTGR